MNLSQKFKNDGIIIRPYQEGDEDSIYNLWQLIYPDEHGNKEDWFQWWHWMYKENPVGQGLIWVAEKDNRIISHHALIPVWIKIGDKKVLGSWGVDAMTHPDFRYQGIWEKVILSLWNEAKLQNIEITFGFPNKNSFPGLIRKQHWFPISQAKSVFKPLDWKAVLSLKIKNTFLLRISSSAVRSIYGVLYFKYRKRNTILSTAFKEITSFDERYDLLWQKVSEQYPISTIRMSDYLNWRFSRPDGRYKKFCIEHQHIIKGYLVLRNSKIRGVKVTNIIDVIAESNEIMQELVSRAVEDCQKENSTAILFSFLAGKNFVSCLKKEGFITLPFRKDSPFCARLDTNQFQNIVRDAQNWFVQPSDTDYI